MNKKNVMIRKLMQTISNCDPTHDEYLYYLNWYKRAGEFVEEVAEYYQKTKEVTAATLAALSPQKPWKQNKKLLVDLAESRPVGHMRQFVDMATKAWSGAGFNALRGPKIVSFAMNLMGDLYQVTIDRIMCRAAGVININGEPKVSPTAQEYDDLAECVYEVTNMFNVRHRTNFKPAEIQALIWCVERGYAD